MKHSSFQRIDVTTFYTCDARSFCSPQYPNVHRVAAVSQQTLPQLLNVVMMPLRSQ